MKPDIIIGDCRDILPTLPGESVQMCVTSPPYYALRDYGTGTWIGGDSSCDHRVWGHPEDKPTPGGRGGSMPKQEVVQRSQCSKCGGIRVDKQIGLEATLLDYIDTLVGVFREVRRVLKPDGTFWLNIGDTYSGSGRGTNGDASVRREVNASQLHHQRPLNLPPKSLLGVPWRLAFALQDDGWILRRDIIWHKTNALPESVTDRCTTAHEYLFMFTKSGRYYYDAKAIAEPASDGTMLRISQPTLDTQHGSDRVPATKNGAMKAVVSDELNRSRMQSGYAPPGQPPHSTSREGQTVKEARPFVNKRSVWSIPTAGYAGAHFATFPRDLVKPCILAGSREGDTVLDPFGGSGTTGEVATALGRRSILVELNPEYAKQADTRTAQTGFDFSGATAD